MATVLVSIAAPADAQRAGQGGLAIEGAQGPTCTASLGTVTVVEEQAAGGIEELPPGLRALIEMAERQQGGGRRVDPVPLLSILAARSQCFDVVDRSAGFAAVERERRLKGLDDAVRAADWVLKAQIIYTDVSGRGGGAVGGLGGGGGSAAGIQLRNLEAQTVLTLIEVQSGVQRAIVTGSARRRDAQVFGGGLVDLGIAALAGAGYNTDIGKVTAIAITDGWQKLASQIVPIAERRQEAISDIVAQ